MSNKLYIDSLFSNEVKENEIVKAHEEIVKIQKNEESVLKTGFEYVDNFLPDGLNNKMIFGGSRPAMGKTYNCAKLIQNLLDPEINTVDVDILRLNWEMNSSSLLLRELKKDLGKKMKDIFSAPYTEEEKPIVRKTVSGLGDKRIVNVSKIIERDDLSYLIDNFCANTPPGTKKVIVVDHLHILTDKSRIDHFLSICNEKKLQYPQLSFVVYFQLNRVLETLWRGSNDSNANPKNFRPHSGHIYNTDALQQYADLIFTLIIPQVVNLDEYASIPKDYYSHLESHFATSSDNNWVRLKGRNRVYVDVIKVRLVDDFDDPRLFCELLDSSKEDGDIKMFNPKNESESTLMPKFDSPEPVEPNFDLENAFGPVKKDGNKDDMPF